MKDQIDVLKELQERVLIKGGVCAGCGMTVPSAVQQAARLGETLVLCPYCSRILYDDREDAVRGTNGGRRTATKSTATLARFSRRFPSRRPASTRS